MAALRLEETTEYGFATSYTLPEEDRMGDAAKGKTTLAARLAEKRRQRKAKTAQRAHARLERERPTGKAPRDPGTPQGGPGGGM
jgi:hypothetical protein